MINDNSPDLILRVANHCSNDGDDFELAILVVRGEERCCAAGPRLDDRWLDLSLVV